MPDFGERYPGGKVRALRDDAPDGWTAINNTLEPTRTLGGYMARREELQGGCRAHGCRRKYWIDEHAPYEKLLAPLPLSTLQRMVSCNRPDGCSFEFFGPRTDQSVRLTVLCGRPNARVRISCSICSWRRLPKAEEVIAVLTKSRTGDGDTPVHLVGEAMAKKPCPKCKTPTTWKAEVVWIRTDTMIWRAKGEQLFDEMT